jgi:isopenicillin N synthase-like dioxygenase
VINHGIESEVVNTMLDASKTFFELPVGEREKLMSNDMFSPVRYGTSFNQNKDGVFCWRDFLKLSCPPADDPNQILSLWPSSPLDFRGAAVDYSKKTKRVYEMLMEGILETLQQEETIEEEAEEKKLIREGNQMMVVNWYPACPEPELTLGMPPHSDYGLLTLLLQDQHVQGLEIYHKSSWLPVCPIPNSFVVNVGDHLEILSNGRYKSVLHRVVVNSDNSRISVASLHTVPITSTVRPLASLVDEANPKRYMDTDFTTFLEYVSSCEPKAKFFLDSRKL